MRKIVYFLLATFAIFLFISCHRGQNEIDFHRIVEIQENAINTLNDLGETEQSAETIINKCIQQLLCNPEVTAAHFQSPNQIVIKYRSGTTGILYLIDEEDNKNKDLQIMSKHQLAKEQGEQVLITNHKVLIWDWFNGGAYNETSALSDLFNNCENIDFDLVVRQGESCTFQSLKDLTHYGFVYIHTHGAAMSNSNGEEVSWILTREKVVGSESNKEDYTSERKIPVTLVGVSTEFVNNQEIRRFASKSTWWAVTNKYISKYVTGTFNSPSIVFVHACHSFDNSSLRNAFIEEKKASAYLGYTSAVYNSFGYAKAIEFVTILLHQRLDSYEAYNRINAKVDNTLALNSWYSWYWEGNPRAMLMYSSRENPTYFGSIGYVECPDLNERWVIGSSHYFPNPYAGTCQFSQLQFLGVGLEFQIVYRLSKMNEMEEGVYTPYIINSVESNIEWENNSQAYPMRFLVQEGNFSESNGSTFWHKPETHFYRITGGQLKYQNQNQIKKYTFNFTGGDGHSYYGEFVECK